jgi:hypothetical protein
MTTPAAHAKRDRPVKRVLVIGNLLAIPYVWIRFPEEARRYTANCFRYIVTGRRF